MFGPQLVNIEDRHGEKFVVPSLKTPAVLKIAHHAHETMMHFMMDAIIRENFLEPIRRRNSDRLFF